MSDPLHPDLCLSGYAFELPETCIAQSPAPERTGSRLMVLDRKKDSPEQARFADLLRYLPENCLLVANNSRVVPARVVSRRPSGGKLEFLLLTPLPLLAFAPTAPEIAARLERTMPPETETFGQNPPADAPAGADAASAKAASAGAEAASTEPYVASAAAKADASPQAEGARHPAEPAQHPAEPAQHPAEAAWHTAEADGLLRPAKKVPRGELTRLAPDLALEVLEHSGFGRCRTRLYWRGELREVLEKRGGLPLPPYIRRADPAAAKAENADQAVAETNAGTVPDTGRAATAARVSTLSAADRAASAETAPVPTPGASAPTPGASAPTPGASAAETARLDAERYQTTYARTDKAGSVAAPTAGLHFTPAMREELVRSGREWAEVTLYVGYGTFSPVRVPDIRDHVMHAEYAELPARTLAAVRKAKAEGRAVIAVGTTSARVLEGVCELRPELFSQPPEQTAQEEDAFAVAFAGWLSTFLYPGKPVRVIDGLITNFHLPESSLLMLVSALAGRERILRAYEAARDSGFRFFSYGDAMLIL